MTKAKQKKLKRLKQVETWLRANYMTPLPVVVRHVRLPPKSMGDADVQYGKKRTLLRISDRFSTAQAITTLIHEWVHAMLYPLQLRWEDPHEDIFYIKVGRIERHFYEGGGLETSMRL